MYKSESIEVEDSDDVCKKDFRKRVWDYLQKNKLAQFPLPVYNRIPNFIGNHESGQKVSELPEFGSAQTIKVNPDKPQEEVRFLTLQANKRLLVPTPRLTTGLFNLLEKEELDDQNSLRVKSQSEGIKKHSKPISLDDKVTIDLVVLGSVAVSKTGRRIGKGEGFADIEYGMMKTMEAVRDDVIIVTAVHDCQVFDDLPSRIFYDHDVPIDIIVTPTQVIRVSHSLPKPQGIYWNLLPLEKFLQIPVLKILYDRQVQRGVDIILADEVVVPDQEAIDRYQEAPRGRGGRTFRRGGKSLNRRGNEDRSEDANDESEDNYREKRPRGRGRGRGRRGGSVRGATSSSNQDQQQDGEDVNIQVTINVNKQNKIVRRKVESTDQKDRVGSADLNGEDRPERRVKRQTPPTFSLFVGGIPRYCRPFELKSELAKRGVRPTYITWRGSYGFAFLNFCVDKEEEEGILSLLKDFTVKNRQVTVDKAKGRTAPTNGEAPLSQEETNGVEEGDPQVPLEETDPERPLTPVELLPQEVQEEAPLAAAIVEEPPPAVEVEQ